MSTRTVLLLLGSAALAACATANPVSEAPMARQADPSIGHRLAVTANTGRARNVILFVGDGMDVTTVTAARIHAGQKAGGNGEEHLLAFEQLPHVALVKTYTTDYQVPDSAGTATAMLAGAKTRSGVINVGPDNLRGDCRGAQRHRMRMLTRDAEQNGMLTGIVTTARITHATPASAYAVSPDRNFESDRDIPVRDQNHCADIARQLVGFDAGDGLDVMLGGGYGKFVGTDLGGDRLVADANLPRQWRELGENRHFVTSREALAAAPLDGQLFGLFNRSHLSFEVERTPDSTEPTLTEMTVRAIDQLAARDQGYFLLVEAGRIDHAHHAARAGIALEETLEFDRAIKAALDRVDLADTLVLVTADHAHTMTIGGYPRRGNPILGLVASNTSQGLPQSAPEVAADGQPYTTLIYANGPGAPAEPRERPRPDTGVMAEQQAAIPVGRRGLDGRFRGSETHGGADVALYAAGPWAHLAGGVLEQHAIYHIMRWALGFDATAE